MTLVRALGLGLLLGATLGTTGGKGAAAPHASSDPRVPSHLVTFGDAAEEAFDAADVGDWPKAALQMERVRGVSAEVKGDASDAGAPRLQAAIASLEAAIRAKERVPTMRAANELTRLGAEFADRFRPSVPTAVTLLDVLGRALRVGA